MNLETCQKDKPVSPQKLTEKTPQFSVTTINK